MSNLETIQTETVAISSRDIADMTNKQHKHVMRDIKVMLDGLELDESKFGRIYLDSMNREQNEFILPKREALILASGYSIKLRAKIIDRLEYLEKNKAPMTIDQLLAYNAKVITFLQEENIVLTKKNKEMLPKAVFADSVAQSEHSILIGQFAKLISDNTFNIGQNRLFKWMRDHGYLHKKGQQYNQPLQRWKEQGLFETIERTVNNPDGSVRLTITTKITGKGQIYFTNKLKPNHEENN